MPARGYEFYLRVVNSISHELACVAGVRRGRKEERRAREAREDRTGEDRGRGRLQGRYCFLYFAL